MENELFRVYANATETTKPEAEAALIKALQRHGHAVCWGILHKHDPEIVNWGIFLALRSATGFRGDAKFSTWFHQIMRNLCFNVLKARKRNPEVAIDDLSFEEQEELAAIPSGESLELAGLLTQLNPVDKGIANMKMEGQSFEEIGDSLGISAVAARQRWFKIKTKLGQPM